MEEPSPRREMETSELNRVIQITLSDKFVQCSFTVITIVFLFTSLIFGFYSGVTVFFSYVSGCLTFHYLLKYKSEIGNVLTVLTKSFQNNQRRMSKAAKCTVCGDKNCNREKIVHKQKPWAGLMIPEEIDNAFENLLEKTLNEFVETWYKKLSLDETFPSELRQNIRYASSVVLSRVLKVNMGVLITKKVIPAAVKHLHMCLSAGGGKVPEFHPALYNRKAELDYLRYRVKEVLPLLLEQPQLECSIFSVLATEIVSGWLLLPLAATSDVTVMNNLFLLITGNQTLTNYSTLHVNQVEFLQKFVENKGEVGLESNISALHPDMCTILKDQALLYAFMQFLKDQGAVHILQFCLDVEEFNRRMLTPELSSEELDLLYRDAWDLYSVYFSPHSPDNIGFDPNLVVQMRKVLSKDVTKLRTSPPLFQAYEHAYSLLDKNYCPLFHTSDEFYTWLCGPRTPCSTNKSGSSSPSLPGSPIKGRGSRREAGGTVSKLSNKLHRIKGVLKSQTVLDGHAYDTDSLQLETDTEFAEELSLMEEPERDLSAWKVRVLHFENKMDPTTGKLVPMYTISVQRITPSRGECGSWTVERRQTDFYALEAKLTEFHGDFPDNQLPPCGLLAPTPPTEVTLYEAYLQKLLNNPALRGSDLLHWFLSSPGEFTVEENGFGKLLRKSVVPLSLRKERGQNIEPFITTFTASTDLRPKKLEWKDYSCEVKPRKIRCLTNTVFGNNLGIHLSMFPSAPLVKKIEVEHVMGPSDSLLYIGMNVIKLPSGVMRLAFALHKYLHTAIDNFFTYYIDKKLQSLLVPQRIAHLINLLQWVVYEKQSKSNPAEVSQAAKERLAQLRGWTAPLYKTLYTVLQQPIMNKQLMYTLIDIVLDELFPEKRMDQEPSSPAKQEDILD